MKIFGVVYPKPITSARADVGNAEKVTAFIGLQRMKCSLGVFRCAFLDHKVELLRPWRPNTKMRFVFADQFRANRIATLCERHDVTLTLISRTTIVGFGDFSFPIQHQQSRTWGRSRRKQPKRECVRESRQLFSPCSSPATNISARLKIDNEELDTGRLNV